MTLRKFNFRSLKVENVTAGSNVVFGTGNSNAGIGTASINFVLGWPSIMKEDATFQGRSTGYVLGGQQHSTPPSSMTTNIEKYPFATNSGGVSVSTLSLARFGVGGVTGIGNGYGYGIGGGDPSGPINYSLIDKFSMVNDTPATNIGNITANAIFTYGHSSPSYGYSSGGHSVTPFVAGPSLDIINKFSFSADGSATDIAELVSVAHAGSSQSSTTHGYLTGGYTYNSPSISGDVIQKFPFSSDTNSSDIGELTYLVVQHWGGQSSPTHGYTTGGFSPVTPPRVDTIQKFPFSSDTSTTDVGELAQALSYAAGNSSKIDGYTTGGTSTGSIYLDTIQKFPFSSDSSATDLAELALIRIFSAGTQI